MIKLRSIRDRFNPVSFKLGGVTDALFSPFEMVGDVLGLGGNIYAAERSKDSVDATNEANLQIAREKNEQEKELFHENLDFQDLQGQISREFNAVEAQRARDFNAEQADINRQFQSVEAQKTREWNAIDAQVSRAKAAGVNPALVAGQGQASQAQAGGSAATGVAASSSPVGGSALPHLDAPMLQNKVGAYQLMANIGLEMSQIAKNFSEAKKTNEEIESVKTFNQYAARLHESGIRVNNATANKLFKDAQLLDELQIKTRNETQLIKAQLMFTEAQEKALDIDNMYKHDYWTAVIQDLRQRASKTEREAWALVTELPVRLGLLAASTRSQNAMAALSNSERKNVEKIFEILTNDKKVSDLQLNILQETGMSNAKNLAKQLDFYSGDLVMTVQILNGMLSSIGQALSGYGSLKRNNSGVRSTGSTSGNLFSPAPGQ